MEDENCYIVKLRDGSDGVKMRNYQRGQVLLITLLVLTVALTVGLSFTVRTITTNRMTSAEDSSQRAFSAAEAGIERALVETDEIIIVDRFDNNNSVYLTIIAQILGDEVLIDNGAFILKDGPADVWLSDYPDYTNPWSPLGFSNLTIYWGSVTDNCVGIPEVNNTMAAVEVILISGTKAVPKIEHFAYDPCNPRRLLNNFSNVLAGGIVKGKNFTYSATISVKSGLLARVVPLYAGSYIGVRGTGLPPQGKLITSIGKSGGTQRRIISFRGYPKPPIELYSFLLFSPK